MRMRDGEQGGSAEAVRISESADVDPQASLGAGTSVWHLAQVREGAGQDIRRARLTWSDGAWR